MRPQIRFVLALAAISFGLAACAPSRAGHDPSLSAVLLDGQASWAEKRAYFLAVTLDNSDWHKRWWIEKTARLLRGGQALGPDDDVEALMKLDERAIIDRFMSDTRFGDTLLDFNMYFLGFKTGSLIDTVPARKEHYAPEAFELSSAIASAQAGLAGGDYFKLFDLTGPLYGMPLVILDTAPQGPINETTREAAISAVQGGLRAALDLARRPGANSIEICLSLQNEVQLVNVLFNQGFPLTVMLKTAFTDNEWYPKLQRACAKVPAAAPEELARALESILARNDALFGELERFEPSRYNPQTVAEFQTIDLAKASLGDRWVTFGFTQVRALPNSSTNYDRKRAAYALKHYFCDDMTPVGVEDPAQHTGGAHGSETSCFACHYKLDPMAGFFRNIGFFFLDMSSSATITFDDNATIERAKYESAWRAPAGSAHDWNIGYVRSSANEKENEYGESLEDLSHIIRAAPESKRCLVKRLFEYFVAENQSVDAGYLRYLSDELQKEAAATSSARAVRETIAKLLTSHAYGEGNLDPKKCYDTAPGGAQPDAPPCRVNFLLQTYCKDCHHDVSDSKYAHLDLTKWTVQADGSRGFPHEDDFGQPVSSRETLAKIAERLSTSDPGHRMPYQRAMPSQDRQELFLWAQEMLTERGGQ